MASLGRVPNAERSNGNRVEFPTVCAASASRRTSGRNGETSAVYRCPLRADAGSGGWRAGSGAAWTARWAKAPQLRSLRAGFTASVLVLTATACAPALGDFERPRPSVLHEDVFPAVGEIAAGLRGEPTSGFPYTDHERELRDRSWALLMPQLERQLFLRWLAEMRRTRIISVERTVPNRSNYVGKLLSEDFRSSGARFARLEMDIRNDRLRFPGFIAAANAVADYDRVRERSLGRTADLTLKERENAIGRIEENRLLIWTVQKSMRERADIYRYALERLVIQTPDDAAIGAERELLALETDLGIIGPPPPQFAVYGK